MPNPNPTTLDEQIAESIELTGGHIGELTLGESLAIIRDTLEAARKEIERLQAANQKAIDTLELYAARLGVIKIVEIEESEQNDE